MASAACFSCRAAVRLEVSTVARVWPVETVSPTATSTVATVPLIGKATVACDTGSIDPTPVSTDSTSWSATNAVR